MNDFNKLIIYLMAIEGKAKDIHYTCSGSDFYGNHLFADRIADGIDDFIDQIKETCILGKGEKPLFASEYYAMAGNMVDKNNTFQSMLDLILDTLAHIETMKNISKGDSKLLDDIASKLQNDKGLLHIMLGDYK